MTEDAPLTRAERKERTRQALLAAAVDLFAAQGIEATSTQEIADAIGLTRGALYASFRSKEELVLTVGQAQSELLDVSCLWRAELPLPDRLELLGVELHGLARRVGDRAVILDLEYFLYAERHPQESETRHARYALSADYLGDRLAEVAQARGEELPLPPRLFATTLFALVRGLWQEELRQQHRHTAAEMAAALRALAGVPVVERTTGIEPA